MAIFLGLYNESWSDFAVVDHTPLVEGCNVDFSSCLQIEPKKSSHFRFGT